MFLIFARIWTLRKAKENNIKYSSTNKLFLNSICQNIFLFRISREYAVNYT